MDAKDIKVALWNIREELYDRLPTGNVNVFDMVVLIKAHIAKLDTLIEEL